VTPVARAWIVDLDDVELAAHARDVLSPDERAGVAAMHFAHDRRRRAAARAALRLAAAAALGRDPATVPLTRDAHGRPVVAGGALHVSLSHSGPVGAVALAGHPVGVDVEHLRADRDELAIARRWFTPAEARLVEAGPDRAASFGALWTAKEAVLKALGTGLAGGLDRVALRLDADGCPRLEALGDDRAAHERWTIAALPAPETYRAAVAVRAPGARVLGRP
jgi:4'-phosphopantetheinyl transferase